jgi:hypothetical protein
MAITARMAMMAITMSSSMRVKPLSSLSFRSRITLYMVASCRYICPAKGGAWLSLVMFKNITLSIKKH